MSLITQQSPSLSRNAFVPKPFLLVARRQAGRQAGTYVRTQDKSAAAPLSLGFSRVASSSCSAREIKSRAAKLHRSASLSPSYTRDRARALVNSSCTPLPLVPRTFGRFSKAYMLARVYIRRRVARCVYMCVCMDPSVRERLSAL